MIETSLWLKNPKCEDIGLQELCKIDPPVSGKYDCGKFTFDGKYVSFVASQDVSSVIVKGGPGANVYSYDPPQSWGDNLHAPFNNNSGEYYDISHVDLCIGEKPPDPPEPPCQGDNCLPVPTMSVVWIMLLGDTLAFIGRIFR